MCYPKVCGVQHRASCSTEDLLVLTNLLDVLVCVVLLSFLEFNLGELFSLSGLRFNASVPLAISRCLTYEIVTMDVVD